MSTIPSLTPLTPIGTEEVYVTDGLTNKRVTLNAIAALAVDTNTGILNVVEDTTPQLGGTLACDDNIVSRPVLEDYAIQGSAIGNVGATRTFDCAVANYFTATLDQACAFTFSNPPASGDAGGFRLVLTNGGAFAITFPVAVDWDGGTAPTLTAAGVDIIDFTTSDAGTIWYGTVVGSDMK